MLKLILESKDLYFSVLSRDVLQLHFLRFLPPRFNLVYTKWGCHLEVKGFYEKDLVVVDLQTLHWCIYDAKLTHCYYSSNTPIPARYFYRTSNKEIAANETQLVVRDTLNCTLHVYDIFF